MKKKSYLCVTEDEMQEEEDGGDGGGDKKDSRVGGDDDEDEDTTSPVAILCVDCSADSALIMSGCADSTAKVFNVSSGKVGIFFLQYVC